MENILYLLLALPTVVFGILSILFIFFLVQEGITGVKTFYATPKGRDFVITLSMGLAFMYIASFFADTSYDLLNLVAYFGYFIGVVLVFNSFAEYSRSK